MKQYTIVEELVGIRSHMFFHGFHCKVNAIECHAKKYTIYTVCSIIRLRKVHWLYTLINVGHIILYVRGCDNGCDCSNVVVLHQPREFGKDSLDILNCNKIEGFIQLLADLGIGPSGQISKLNVITQAETFVIHR